MSIESPQQKKNLESLKTTYEPLLWQRAEELSELRTQLKEHQQDVYHQTSEMKSRSLNLHEHDVLNEKEAEFWRIERKLQEIVKFEDQVQQALQQLEEGTINEFTLKSITPLIPKKTEQISKRKARILEEQQRIGLDPREIAYDMYAEFGYQPTTHLTTGRHQKHVKGNLNSLTAKEEFFHRTADTHGGKVNYGKKNGYFTNASGKRIRKI